MSNALADRKPDSKPILKWLRGHRDLAGRYLGLTTIVGALGGLLIVAQAWLIALSINAVLFEDAALADVEAWLWLGLAVLIGRSVLVWLGEVFSFRGAAQVRHALRIALFDHIRALGPVALHQARGPRVARADRPPTDAQAAGALANTLTDGIEGLEGYYARYLPATTLMGMLPLILLLFVYPADWLSGTMMLVTAPLIPLFMILIGKGAESLNQKQWRELARMSAHFLDIIQGLTTLKLFNASKREAAIIGAISERFRISTMRVLRVAFLSSAVLEFFATVSIALVAVFIGFRLLAGEMDFLYGFFVLLIAPEFYLPLRNLGTQYHARMEAVGAAEQMIAVLDQALPPRPNGNEFLDRGRELKIEFDAVELSYEADRKALDSVSFAIPPGETLAVIGASGAGKTSLMNLLLGFVEPDAGALRINGTPLPDLDLAGWRSHIAWLPQNPRLFAGSIADNIRLGAPDADDTAVIAAARAAHADAFIDKLPHGYETAIGEAGAGLSGGQIQRIALARAYLRDAPLLILDEPTASLDAESETLINDALAVLCRGRSVILIAHRLQTLSLADRILVMEDGRIAQIGRAEQLAAEGGAYAGLLAAWEGTK
ncbi:MAG: thiol reductant ABC exporter subunit CydD [Gammaproteobacteria bacterium]|nr:thiol reductant ABC exporter subunit CydD [Gammaproteobacteria bacterium]MCP5136523.1 thiol reductant ABC exporter subunit CydD [Gammaproteobacteria bacterium]